MQEVDTGKKTQSFRKSLGLFELVSLGVGGTIGSGIFIAPGVAARISRTCITSGMADRGHLRIVRTFSLAVISSRFRETRSFFGLFSAIFGEHLAIPIILLYLISAAFGVATIAAGIGQYLVYLGFQSVLPIEIAIIILFCGINIIGISLSGKTENVLTVLKTVPLVVIALLLLPHIRPENFVLSSGISASSIIATVIIVYWPFTGFEISAIPIEETKDISLIWRSLIIVMVIVTSVYLLLNISLIGSVGWGHLQLPLHRLQPLQACSFRALDRWSRL